MGPRRSVVSKKDKGKRPKTKIIVPSSSEDSDINYPSYSPDPIYGDWEDFEEPEPQDWDLVSYYENMPGYKIEKESSRERRYPLSQVKPGPDSENRYLVDGIRRKFSYLNKSKKRIVLLELQWAGWGDSNNTAEEVDKFKGTYVWNKFIGKKSGAGGNGVQLGLPANIFAKGLVIEIAPELTPINDLDMFLPKTAITGDEYFDIHLEELSLFEKVRVFLKKIITTDDYIVSDRIVGSALGNYTADFIKVNTDKKAIHIRSESVLKDIVTRSKGITMFLVEYITKFEKGKLSENKMDFHASLFIVRNTDNGKEYYHWNPLPIQYGALRPPELISRAVLPNTRVIYMGYSHRVGNEDCLRQVYLKMYDIITGINIFNETTWSSYDCLSKCFTLNK